MEISFEQFLASWNQVHPYIAIPVDEESYRERLKTLEILMSKTNDRLTPSGDHLIGIIASGIQQYEEKQMLATIGGGVAALRYLMKMHRVRQADLPEIGSQGVVSEILNGKRRLSVRHINALAERFNVSPSTFLA